MPEDEHTWLQTWYGQAITGYPNDDDRILIQDGHGANGKSTIVNGCVNALGDYATPVSHKVLLANTGDHPTETMSLKGARFAVLEELPEGGRVNDHQLKMIAGTDKIKARRMRQDDTEFTATHSLIVNTNHMPVVTNADHATWRRLVLLRFPYKFIHPTEKILAPNQRHGDPSLRERIMDNRGGQLEAVLAWLVAGAMQWYVQGSTLKTPWPERVKAETDSWQADADPILNYIQERLTFDPECQVLSKELYEDFAETLRASGRTVWNDQTFTSRFLANELVSANRVEKSRKLDPKCSRRLRPDYGMPITGKVAVWSGIRFN